MVAIFKQNINWDEFALFERAVRTVGSERIVTGGRPGLGTLVLLPLANGCRNTVHSLVTARLWWLVPTFGGAWAFWLVLRALIPAGRHQWAAAATGVSLWILAPPFLRYSVEVRTDQPAILFGLCGGLALMATKRRGPLAAAAGASFGVGFLFSQKLVYVAALVIVLAAGQLLIRREWLWKDVVLRGTTALLTFAAILFSYQVLAAAFKSPPQLLPVQGSLHTFDYYRSAYGWHWYLRMLPLLLPQLLVPVALIVVTALAVSRSDNPAEKSEDLRLLGVAWLVALAGFGVVLFHAARFPYFYMVLGLFPAAAGALTLLVFFRNVRSRRARAAFAAMIWVPMAGLGITQAAQSTLDRQKIQRESLAFVSTALPPEAHGFGNKGEFVCRKDTHPFPVLFGMHVVSLFSGEAGEKAARDYIRGFRRRPVWFMVAPDIPFHPLFRSFWQTHYVLYRGAVRVPGRRVRGGASWSGTFESVVTGAYVWLPDSPTSRLRIGREVLAAGGTTRLIASSTYRLKLPEGGSGILVLSLPEPPAADTGAFYVDFLADAEVHWPDGMFQADAERRRLAQSAPAGPFLGPPDAGLWGGAGRTRMYSAVRR